MTYHMAALAERILSQSFILQELTAEIQKLLGLKYTRPILEALCERESGMSFREIDVGIIGVAGSAGSASKTLKKLTAAGWVTDKNERYIVTKKGREALLYARQGDSLSPEEQKGRGA